jgi:hypothetical protein
MSRGILLLIGLLAAVLIPVVLGGSETWSRLQSFPFAMVADHVRHDSAVLGHQHPAPALAARAISVNASRRLKSLGVVMAAEFAYCATPGGSGGPLTIMASAGPLGVRPARGSAVFAMDQLSDLLFFLCALSGILIYALFQHLSDRLEWMLTVSAVSLFGGLFSCVLSRVITAH